MIVAILIGSGVFLTLMALYVIIRIGPGPKQ